SYQAEMQKQLKEELKELHREKSMVRENLSRTTEELLRYCRENENSDHMLFPQKDNPFVKTDSSICILCLK
ncbi:hypothetical protein JJB27_10665, partial [Campylobacter fetus subsp. venerealis]|nr:hypothetical protein [Campylobacter fetus subsp. venerealis]